MDSSAPTTKALRPLFDSAEQEAFLNLWRTYDCLKALEEKLFSQYDLSAQQYNALRLLKSSHPRSMQTLALARLLISRSPDITRMLDRLKKRGLIDRSRREDNRRVVEVSITPAGLSLLNEMSVKVIEMHRDQLGHLKKGDLKDLVALLKKARQPVDDSSCDWLDR